MSAEGADLYVASNVCRVNVLLDDEDLYAGSDFEMFVSVQNADMYTSSDV